MTFSISQEGVVAELTNASVIQDPKKIYQLFDVHRISVNYFRLFVAPALSKKVSKIFSSLWHTLLISMNWHPLSIFFATASFALCPLNNSQLRVQLCQELPLKCFEIVVVSSIETVKVRPNPQPSGECCWQQLCCRTIEMLSSGHCTRIVFKMASIDKNTQRISTPFNTF